MMDNNLICSQLCVHSWLYHIKSCYKTQYITGQYEFLIYMNFSYPIGYRYIYKYIYDMK